MPWLPQKGVEIYPPLSSELDAFLFQQLLLSDRALARNTDRALRVYHALPRNSRASRKRVHRIAHQPRLPAQTSESRNLPVRCDASTRYS